MKVREVLRLLRDDGWFEVATRGSHVQFKNPTKAGLAPLEETKARMQTAITMHVQGLREDRLPIPEPSAIAEYVEVAS